MLLAHLDVVAAKREDWSFDQFEFRELAGYFYGRGTSDDKAMAAIFTANLIRMKREGSIPERDIILALTADEEGGDNNGVDWLLKEHRELVAAAYGLNEGGGGQISNGKRLLNAVQASEKVYVSYHLDITNKGGHSSRPTSDNAIYQLADALAALARFEFPVSLNEVTRGQRLARTRPRRAHGGAVILRSTGISLAAGQSSQRTSRRDLRSGRQHARIGAWHSP